MIEAKLGLDTSGFKKGIAEATSGLKGLTAGLVGLGTFMGAFKGLANGVFDALSRGKELKELSDQTGVSAGRLVSLQTAMSKVGLEADEAGQTLNKLQKRIGEAAMQGGESAVPFQRLGLEINKLANLSADQQLVKVGQALMAVKNPTERATLAMKVFEESGGKMIRLFATGMGSLTGDLSKNAQIFEDNAEALNRAAIALNNAKLNFGSKGFFGGVATQLAPGIEAGSNITSQVLTPQLGQKFGAIFRDLAKTGFNPMIGIASGMFGNFGKDFGKVTNGNSGAQRESPFTFPSLMALQQGGETIASSLQRIGGGGNFAQGGNAMLSIARQIEQAVKQIQLNTEASKNFKLEALGSQQLA